MFELSIASKYLFPRWKQLSLSLISVLAVGVIALVVWLVIVFFSVEHGLERSWVDKLVTLTAPIRITPTSAYYRSPYYLIDEISHHSQYTLKSVGEKLNSEKTDPYDPLVDEEIPQEWPEAFLDEKGDLKDLVKESVSLIKTLPFKGIQVGEFNITYGTLNLIRGGGNPLKDELEEDFSQPTYLGTFDGENKSLKHALLPLENEDFTNLKNQLESFSNWKDFFHAYEIEEMTPSFSGWILPPRFYPLKGEWQGLGVANHQTEILTIYIPSSRNQLDTLLDQLKLKALLPFPVKIKFEEGSLKVSPELPLKGTFLVLSQGVELASQLVPQSIENAESPHTVQYALEGTIQGVKIKGVATDAGLDILKGKIKASDSPFWVMQKEDETFLLPSPIDQAEPLLLPRAYRQQNIKLGDRGQIAYFSGTLTGIQEQSQEVFIAGFYDPGILPVGNKYAMASPQLVGSIRASQPSSETHTNGFNIRFQDLSQTKAIKQAIEKEFLRNGLAPYWKVEAYWDYEFAKDLMQQLHSEQHLFGLLAILIILVACSNIISMLILLVNDKKLEIGILRALGASTLSIAAIFGLCGFIIGAFGSLLGIFAALLTLRNLETILGFIGKVQGYEVFNPRFYGEVLPSDLSFEALGFALAVTAVLSLIAGLVPACKACYIDPSQALKHEG